MVCNNCQQTDQRGCLDGKCIVKVSDLRLGDRIQLFDAEYGNATVYRITDTEVYVWRPYVKVDDFVYSGNRVIPYIGLEDFPLYRGDTKTVRLWRRNPDPLR